MPSNTSLRLAALALTKTYGVGGLQASYPQYSSMTVEGDKIRVDFTNAEAGLMAKGGELTEFFIAGEDKVFHPAKAVIKGTSVVVSAKGVKKPVAVRFGFSNVAMSNLFSKDGLPVGIFRTDNWEVTDNAAK